MNGSSSSGPFALVQEQVLASGRISIKTTLTLTLSRPTGEGTARLLASGFQSAWIGRPAEDDSPSPIGWEYLFSVVATQTNGARRLCRFHLVQPCDVAELPEPRNVQTVKRPEGRAPDPLLVGQLNTYRWERAGVGLPLNPKFFLHASFR
jgi:hypothetical protein